ncbi:MAG: N-methyl-L-tryptophan oxidase [Pedosphaera sp.]|nr:N-methyl-L-tryptophan oxidase [Pedosphaera sp.]
MSRAFDVIVLGLGGMGSAAAAHLAARGQRVLGLEQFTAPHDQGSSHGRSRVIRQAYFEDPAYVPLLLRAYELWRELERDSGRELLTITGGLMLGAPDSAVVSGSHRSAKQHGLAHELLDACEIKRRFPQFHPDADTVALYEKNAGVVRPEESVRAHLDLATRRGATLRMEERVESWSASADSARVKTARGEYEAGQLVISAGPWAGEILRELNLPFQVERQVQLWFEPNGGVENFLPGKFPVWIWETTDGAHPYGLPALDGPGGGVKFAIHHGGKDRFCTAATVERNVSDEEIALARAQIASRLPALDGPCLRAVTCLYTTLPDEHFLIDRHPSHPPVLIVSPCSGHGFKFCPVVGEIVADFVEHGKTRRPVSLFRLDRLKV